MFKSQFAIIPFYILGCRFSIESVRTFFLVSPLVSPFKKRAALKIIFTMKGLICLT